MSSEIEWLRGSDGAQGETWNPTTGCTPVSPGCLHCYAAAVASRGMCSDHRGLTKRVKRRNGSGRLVHLPVFNGTIHMHRDRLGDPIQWRKPRRVFVDSMSDLFHEGVPFEFILQTYLVMKRVPRHTFLLLTKRDPRSFFERAGSSISRAPNVQIGFSAENQAEWDRRRAWFRDVDAPVKWVSIEPMLGPIDMQLQAHELQWVVVGGESGAGARPFDIFWARSIIEQCDRACVPVFVKQLGARPLVNGAPLRLTSRKGKDPNEWPKDLRRFDVVP